VGIVGGVLGVLTFFDSRETDLRLVSPSPVAIGLGQPEDTPIQLGIVNNSQKGVSLVSGRLTHKGRRVARVVGAVTNPQAATRLDPVELRENARRLPVSIPAGSSSPIALLPEPDFSGAMEVYTDLFGGPGREPPRRRTPPSGLRVSVSCPTGWTAHPERTRPGQPRPPSQVLFGPPPAGRPTSATAGKLDLELTFDPGGTERVSVGFTFFGSTTGNLPPIAPNPWEMNPGEARRGWIVGLELENLARGERRIRWLYVHSPLQEPGAATLKVWGESAARPTEFTRPMRPGRLSCFPLGKLGAGRYEWVVEYGGDTVATGAMANPCPKRALRQYMRGFRRPSFRHPLAAWACEPEYWE
jgi:hypothetical protein